MSRRRRPSSNPSQSNACSSATIPTARRIDCSIHEIDHAKAEEKRNTDTTNDEEASTSASNDTANVPEEVHSDGETQTDGDTIVVEIDHPRRSSRETQPPARYSKEFAIARIAVSDYDEPQTLKEALARPDAKQWEQAAQTEYDSILENGTWEVVDKFQVSTSTKLSPP
jgi:hypothetical protein